MKDGERPPSILAPAQRESPGEQLPRKQVKAQRRGTSPSPRSSLPREWGVLWPSSDR